VRLCSQETNSLGPVPPSLDARSLWLGPVLSSATFRVPSLHFPNVLVVPTLDLRTGGPALAERANLLAKYASELERVCVGEFCQCTRRYSLSANVTAIEKGHALVTKRLKTRKSAGVCFRLVRCVKFEFDLR